MAQPNALEQYLLELLNRARQDPKAEAARYGLSQGQVSSQAKQPLAFDFDLNDAAQAHSKWMLETDTFSHTGENGSSPGDRMAAAGYNFTGSWKWAENIRWQSTLGQNETDLVESQHKGLFLSSGHRKNILDGDFREVGIDTSNGKFGNWNAQMVTENFAKSGSTIFLTGVAYDDSKRKNDDFYTPGEGLGGISVRARRLADNRTFSTNTWSSGGYNLELSSGTYEVTFSGSGVNSTQTVTIGSQNVKLDFDKDDHNSTSSGGSVAGVVESTTGDDRSYIRGTSRDDNLIGTDKNQTILGRGGDDDIDGGNGNDRLFGNSGNDDIIGGAGDDLLVGGSGDDTLTGVNPNASKPGANEIDEYKGDRGEDIFVLGDRRSVYYKYSGNNDYAKIKGFELGKDTVELHGSARDYRLVESGSSTQIWYDGSRSDDLIGVLEGTVVSDFAGGTFDFV